MVYIERKEINDHCLAEGLDVNESMTIAL